jgi:hypothetical protein
MSSNNGNLCGAEKWLRWVHDVGYMPDTKFVLHDVEEEGNMSGLCHHMTEDGCCIWAHHHSWHYTLHLPTICKYSW